MTVTLIFTKMAILLKITIIEFIFVRLVIFLVVFIQLWFIISF